MTLQIERIQALCFDIDGTLSDTDDVYVSKIARWLRPGRIILPQQDEYQLARRLVMGLETPGNFLYGFSDRLGLDSALGRWENYLLERNWRRAERRFILMPGAGELLAALHAHFPMAIVTTRGSRTARAFLDQHGLTDFFQVIVSGLTVRRTKPHPDPILYAAQQMQVLPEACLMIGDTTVDIVAGNAAGAQTVGVLCGFGKADELQRAGAHLILRHTRDLGKILLDSPFLPKAN